MSVDHRFSAFDQETYKLVATVAMPLMTESLQHVHDVDRRTPRTPKAPEGNTKTGIQIVPCPPQVDSTPNFKAESLDSARRIPLGKTQNNSPS